MGRGVPTVSARKILEILSSVMKSCRNLNLQLAHCMTYNSSYSDEQESDGISFGGCPYVYYSNIVNSRYIVLPHYIII